MPRKARIDAPVALHHIICRGIEKRQIFKDDVDRDRFVEGLGAVLQETATPCYAWALIPNHFHLLIRTGLIPVASLMRRLLTGYAVNFNHRHRRSGHLFQKMQSAGWDFEAVVSRACELFDLTRGEVLSGSKQRNRVAARSVAAYWAVEELGMSATAVAERMKLSPSAASRCVQRGERIVATEGWFFKGL